MPKICQHNWKERLEITKIAKFESDLFLVKTNEDIAWQSGEMFNTDVGAHTNVCKIATLWSIVFALFGRFSSVDRYSLITAL